MKVIGTRAVHAALVVLLVSAAGVAALVAVGPRTGVYRTLTVLSGSMRPAFDPGSVVIVRPTPFDDLEVGDVVTYQIPVDDHRVVSHRIIEIEAADGGVIVRTQGDANVAADPWTTRLTGDEAWRVAAAIPRLGYGIAVLRTPLASLFLLLTGPLGLCIVFLRDIWRRDDELRTVSESAVDLSPPQRGGSVSLDRPRVVVDTLVLGANGLGRVARWTDDVLSGRRWLRSSARHA